MTAEDARRLCPSSPPREGALLIGVWVGGRTAYLKPAIAVTRDDLDGAGDDVDRRFRFSLPCQQSRCHHFSGRHCGLVGRLITERVDRRDEALESAASADLPACAIRARCEWFATEGARACGVCPTVFRP